MLLSKWAACNDRKSKFIKEQKDKGLLSNLIREKNANSKWFIFNKSFVLKI